MEFDSGKVVGVFHSNLNQWIGWKGFFSDYLEELKENVEKETGIRTVRSITRDDCPFETEEDKVPYQFFYPVNPPEKEQKLVPFDTCWEFINWYCKIYGIVQFARELPVIWVKEKGTDRMYLINGFSDSNTVYINGRGIFLEDLTKSFTLLDCTPIGREVKE